jgi:hypothetical protein
MLRMKLPNLCTSLRKATKKTGLAVLINRGMEKESVRPCSTLRYLYRGGGNNIFRSICGISAGGNQSYGRLGEEVCKGGVRKTRGLSN